MRQRSWVWVAGAAAVLVLVLAPYLAAWRAQPSGFVFSGFLVNPIDGFSYLAKMRQGAGGSWLFRLPYAAEPGPGAVLFVYYLLLGHVQRMLGASPLVVYHGARLLGTAAMLAAAAWFFRATLVSPGARAWAMALTFFGSGLGWLGLAIGRTAVDLWVPEAIPFFSALSNAHFPLAAAALLVAVTAFSATSLRRGVRFLAAGGSGLLLGAVQPFAVLPAVLVGAVWGVWTTVRPPKDAAPSEVRRDQLVSGLVFLATSVPWLLYDLWVTRTYSALAAWSAQNLTPTPPAQDVFLGFGLVFALSVASLWIARPADSLGGRMLLTWLSVGLVLVFVPFGLQRRMMLGAFFPMAGLAGLVLSRLADAGGGRKLLAFALFLLCLPSNLVVLTASLGGTLGQQPEVVLTEPEIKAYRWMEDRVPPGSLVLAGEVSGNRLPAFTDSRVVYGHPFETPDAALTLAWVDSTFTDVDPEASLARLREMSIDYVFVGPRERSLGPLTWLSALQSVYEADGVAVYRVGAP